MYTKADVKNARVDLVKLLNEKSDLIQKSETIPQSLWDAIEEAYERFVYVQRRYNQPLENYIVNKHKQQ